MAISLSPLPYAQDALAPVVSARTMDFHYGKHHRGYVDKLIAQLSGTDLEHSNLEDIVRSAWRSGNQSTFNNAAQAWNHDFFWHSLSPDSGPPGTELEILINRDFGSRPELLKSLVDAALAQFGSGWAWLVVDGGHLRIVTTSNADCPLVHEGQTALLTIDVWEHAYYLDYQNDRKRYVETLAASLLNWDAASARLKLSASQHAYASAAAGA